MSSRKLQSVKGALFSLALLAVFQNCQDKDLVITPLESNGLEINEITILESQSFVVPQNVTKIILSGSGAGGGGGGGGAQAIKDQIIGVSPGEIIDIEIRSPGDGGASGGGSFNQPGAAVNGVAGIDGGSVSFGEYLTLEGGKGGAGAYVDRRDSAGGLAGGIGGANGGNSRYQGNFAGGSNSGFGGDSLFGKGGSSVTGGDGKPGEQFGSGGSGGNCGQNGKGGKGAPGFLRLRWQA